MSLTIEFDQEQDGRWIAEVPELPGVLVYGQSKADARKKAYVLALQVIADRVASDEMQPLDRLAFGT